MEVTENSDDTRLREKNIEFLSHKLQINRKFGLRNDGIEIVFCFNPPIAVGTQYFAGFLQQSWKVLVNHIYDATTRWFQTVFLFIPVWKWCDLMNWRNFFFCACLQPESMDGCQFLVLSSSRSPFSALGRATRMALCCDAGSTSGKLSFMNWWREGSENCGTSWDFLGNHQKNGASQWVLFAETLTPRRRSKRSLEPYMVALSSAARWGGELGSYGKPMGNPWEYSRRMIFSWKLWVFFSCFFFGGGLEFFFGGWEDGKMLGIFGLDWNMLGKK